MLGVCNSVAYIFFVLFFICVVFVCGDCNSAGAYFLLIVSLFDYWFDLFWV